jgi:hypothetical protein
MSRDIKKYVLTCDICQKAKPKTHGPIGLLQPIPIPERPFDVVTMDFITELPESEGYNAVLVMVDKLTKFVKLIPTTTKLDEQGTAEMFFKEIVSQYGLPKQIITDRDSRWTGTFWREVCKKLNLNRSLTTAHHPQADGQTEVMNQILETALRCYVSPTRNDWSKLLNVFTLAYNTTPHSATGFSPAFLLYGYLPRTTTTILHLPNDQVVRPSQNQVTSESGEEIFESENAKLFLDEFETYRLQAKEALSFAQVTQQRNYNKGRLIHILEFEPGDLVLINPHSLELLRHEKGAG